MLYHADEKGKVMELKFPKLYRYDRVAEHCNIAIPVAKGKLKNTDSVQVFQAGKCVPVQTKVTSRYEDGSIRYLFVRFLADLPANKRATLECKLDSAERAVYEGLQVEKNEKGFVVKAGVEFSVSHNTATLFDWLRAGEKIYGAKQFVGPLLEDGNGNRYGVQLGEWELLEQGPLVAVLRCKGECVGTNPLRFEMKVTAYAEKSWVEISYRLINTTDEPLHVASLVFALLAEGDAVYNPKLVGTQKNQKMDSTGCGDANQSETDEGPVFETTGISKLPQLQEKIDIANVRTCVGNSNYKTKFSIGKDGTAVDRIVDAKYLVGEANEHFAEVIYGTFFADRTDSEGGVCATVFQAQQNYPKAVKADDSGIYVMLVPKDIDKVVMQSGMSREQRFQLYFHESQVSLIEIDNRSLIYQMPDRPHIVPEVFKEAGVMPDIFVDKDKIDYDVELSLIGKCDGHARSYGMLNWGEIGRAHV